jgi:hypothetical protein
MDTLLPASGRKMKLAGCSISTRYGKCKQHDGPGIDVAPKFFEVSGPIAGSMGCLMASESAYRNECQRFSLAMGGFK